MSEMSNQQFYDDLTWPQKAQVQKLQLELSDQGYGDDEDFPMKKCWNKAVEELRKKIKVSGGSEAESLSTPKKSRGRPKKK